MENYDLVYSKPEVSVQQGESAPLRQAVKAMIFGIVALTLAEIPFFGFFSAPVFAIISLCMQKDYAIKYPGQMKARGFLKAGRICAIISLPLCVVGTILYLLLNIFTVAGMYYSC